ncbi:MAG: hypothetical protein IJC20_01795, partial [Clostridia bacterium]|nr:hypothetical protein [Clostridia bacterium]
MNKTFKRILAAFLVLCMIPAAVITAFAHGPGVAGNTTPNQSYDNAKGQFIPETIVVDGKFDDTGWAIEGWNYVTSSTGNWDVDVPETDSRDLMYQYQLRADSKYFYVGAVVVLPAGISVGNFNVYLSDDKAGDYELTTAAFQFSLSNGSITVNAIDCKTDDGVDVCITNGDKFLKAELVDNNKYYIEFCNEVADTYNSANEIRYFVSASITTNGKENELFHPIYYNQTGSHSVPTAEVWPGGGKVLSCIDEDKDALKGAITVDGNFDEAIWDNANEASGFKAANLVVDSGWTEVTPYNGGRWQSTNSTIDGFSYKYKLASDGTKLYVAVLIDSPYVNGDINDASGTNVRLWLNTNPAYTVQTHYYDVSGAAIRSRQTTSTSDGTKHNAITNSSIEYKINPQGDKTHIEFSVNLSEFNGQNGFRYFLAVAGLENGQAGNLYSTAYSNTPWTTWDTNADLEVSSIDDIRTTGTFAIDGNFNDSGWNYASCDVLQNITTDVKYDQDYMYGKVTAQLKSNDYDKI